jgi:hypothetical protein
VSGRTYEQDSAAPTVSQTYERLRGRRLDEPSAAAGSQHPYFGDATLASAFVARWCVGAKVETAGGVFQVREDQPAPWIGAGLPRSRKAAPDQLGRIGEAQSCDERGMINALRCFGFMNRASHYRRQADHARQLAEATWQPDLEDMLRHLAQDLDEMAEDLEAGATEIRHDEPLR